ncbi:L-histidine N(alpha)-methyltransferase [Azohydromonas aeria]|uniref:L-histidine N(alpha)-methyltransferase n=1 Tax=Azohydromonas aeria TaxID=2590212 RepID=UPI0012F7A793|nr:L-histidine N(alpha)-methyltransferase [Azohydromonas aeria]
MHKQAPNFIEAPAAAPAHHAAELAAGLLQQPACVAPKHLYDPLGCRLFEAITELPEYAATRTEAAILAAHGEDVARVLGTGLALVDLGAGNCAKAASLFPLLQPSHYVAVDIAAGFIREALSALRLRHPGLPMTGVALDFSQALALPAGLPTGPRLMFYPGSSIGNFEPAHAQRFLRQAREQSLGGALLIGVDLVKPLELLLPAYDDALGVTAAFNRNLLLNVNRQLGTDFDPADWAHLACFDAAASRIEMHLRAVRDVTVRWDGERRDFPAGATIHTENSYKYRIEQFDALLHAAGWSDTRCWTDEHQGFAVFAARG